MAKIDFQPLDFEPVEETSPTEQNKSIPKQEAIQFEPIQFEPVESVAPTNIPTSPISNTVEQPVPQKPIQPTNNTEYLPQERIDEIANKYGLSSSDLRSVAPYYGVKLKPKTFNEAIAIGSKGTAGFAGRSLLFNIPQFLYKKTQNPEMAKAIDELQGIASDQETPLETAAEIVASPIAGIGKTALPRLASTIGIGAAQGAATSKSGEEIQGATTGAAFGGALGATGEVIGKLARMSRNIEPGKIDTTVRSLQANVGEEVEKKLASRRLSNSDIEEAVLRNKPIESADQVDRILNEQLGPQLLPTLRDSSSAAGRDLRKQVLRQGLQGTNENLNKQLAQNILDDSKRSFARELTGSETTPTIEEASQIIQKQMERNPQIADKYKNWVETRTALDAIEEYGLRSTGQPGFVGRAFEFFSPNEYVARHIDDKFGRNIEKVLRDGSNDFNRSTFTLSKFRNANDELSDMADKAGIGDKLRSNPEPMYEALNSGDFSKFGPEERSFADQFRKTVEMYRQEMNATGRINIPQLQNYVPRTVKKTVDLVPTVEKKINSALKEASEFTGREIRDLGQLNNLEMTQLERTSPALKDLISYKGFVEGEAQKKLLPGDLSAFLKDSLYSSNGRRLLDLKANAAIERTEGASIPDWMIEKNPFQLLDKWSMNTVRGAFLGPTVNKLRNEVRILKKLGADVDAHTVEKMAQDLLGPRRGTMASATLNGKLQYQKSLDTLIDKFGEDSVSGKLLNNLRVAPEVSNQIIGQIYPNVLGNSIPALVTNLGGNYVKMLPELGSSKYALGLANRATANNILNFNKNIAIAKEIGNVPAEFTRNQNRAIAEGVQRSAPYKIGSKATEKLNKASMYLFSKTEEFNRGVAVELAKQLTKDIASGNKAASEVINNMPVSMRKSVMSKINQPDEMALELSKYFNNVISQNYNKLSASEFARTAGPLFSAFTKWPSVALGEAAYEMRSKGLSKGLARNAALVGTPWLVLRAIDYASGRTFDRDEDTRSDTQKAITGSEGLTKLAPVGALASFGSGQFFTPPAIQTVRKGISTLADENKDTDEAIQSVASEVTRNFVPGMGLLKFITQDIPTLLEGEKVEGDNFFEKTEEGISRITK